MSVLLIVFLGIAISFFIFGNTVKNPFLFDDVHLEQNKQLYHLGNTGKIFSSSYHFIKSGVYRPIPMLSYAVNQRILGDSVVSFRIFQIILYGLNGALLFLVLKKIGLNFFESTVASLVFLFHPINNEVVNVVVFRHDILVVTLGLLAILSRLKGKSLWAYVFFFLSLLSKETGLMIMLILLYYLFFLTDEKASSLKGFFQKLKELKKDVYYFLLTLFVYMLFRLQVLKDLVFYDPTTIVQNQLRHLPFFSSIPAALKVVGLYVVKMLYPKTLSIDYSYNQISTPVSIIDPLAILGFLALVSCVLVLLPAVRMNFKYKIAILFFLFPLLIVSNLFLKIGSIAAERWLYLPSAGFAILVSIFLSKLFYSIKSRKVFLVPLILVILLGGYYYRNFLRNKDWQDGFSLYKNTAAASPNSVLARNNLGAMYLLKKDYSNAKIEIEAATKIYPDYPQLLFNWGIYYQETGNEKQSEEYFLKTLEVAPEYLDAYSRLISIYVSRNDYEKAVTLALRKFEISENQEDLNILNLLIKTKSRRPAD